MGGRGKVKWTKTGQFQLKEEMGKFEMRRYEDVVR